MYRNMSSALLCMDGPVEAVLACKPLLRAVVEARGDIDTGRFESALSVLEARMDKDSVSALRSELEALSEAYASKYGLEGPWII